MSKLFEGKYDKLTGIIVDAIWNVIKESKEFYKETDESEYGVGPIEIDNGIKFDLYVLTNRTDDVDTYSTDGATYKGNMYIMVNINPDDEHLTYTYVNSDLQSAVRHELEHILQFQGAAGKAKFPLEKEVEELNIRDLDYFLSDHETEAMVTGFYRLAKNRKKPLDHVIDIYLEYFQETMSITEEEAEIIKKKWLDYAKKRFPDAQYKNIVSESLNEYMMNI